MTRMTRKLQQCQQFCKSLVLWGGIFLLTLLLFIFVYGPASIFFDLRARQKIVHWWGMILTSLTKTRIRVSDSHQLESFLKNGNLKQPLVIVANHKSWIDIPVLATILSVPFVFVAKESLFRIPLVGFILSRAGYISVDRKRTRKAFATLKRAGETLGRLHAAVVIVFPEGTRTLPEQEMLPFKSGAFLLARTLQAQILPIVMHGAEKVIPAKQKHFVQRIGKGEVTVRFLKPIQITGVNKASLPAIKSELALQMREAYNRMTPRSSVDRAMVS